MKIHKPALTLFVLSLVPAFGQKLQTLYIFPDVETADQPVGNLLLGRDGSLYGETWYVPVVFRIVPPRSSGGTWKAQTLVMLPFQSIGTGGLTSDGQGHIYGAEEREQFGPGKLFQVKPPAALGKPWTYTDIYSFDLPDTQGSSPWASPIFLNNALWGTTAAGGSGGTGVVYALREKPSGTWTYSVLHSFSGPDGATSYAPLIADQHGNLYGTTSGGGRSGNGVVFELSPPSSPEAAWTYSLLYEFKGGAEADGADPEAGLLLGKDGSLYGTTVQGGNTILCNGDNRIGNGCGTAFKLTPPAYPGGVWKETILHAFTGYDVGQDGGAPLAPLTWGADGQLYGTTGCGGSENQGSIFALTPPTQDDASWGYHIVWDFDTGTNNWDRLPEGGLTRGANGVLFGTTSSVDFDVPTPGLPGGSVFVFVP